MKFLGLIVLAALLLWMYMRQRQRRTEFDRLEYKPRKTKSPAMQRIGTPGTITPEQTEALQRTAVRPSRRWSFEEAALILDSIEYLRAVCAKGFDGAEPPEDVQNKLMGFILLEDELREHVRQWGEARREAGDTDQPPAITANAAYERVVEEARRLASG